MIFVPAEKLKKGMRLAKPIYNKQGVMLYERDSKLTAQGIQSVRNFGLIGLYILEPAEPLPPFTEADREFERFQTMSVFTLQEIMQDIRDGHQPQKLQQLTMDVLRRFGNSVEKIGFTQNLRSPEDNVYKHSLNVAILAAAIYGKLAHNPERQRYVVMSALLHDIGSLDIPEEISHKKTKNLTNEDHEVIERCKEEGYRLLRENCDLDSEVMKNISYLLKDLKVTVNGFRPIEEAIVTSGGVHVKEVDPKTMQSKLCEGLYFAGEVLDVDAYTGGFNLQIAFSTGHLAGESV